MQSRVTIKRRKLGIVLKAIAANRRLLSQVLLSPRLKPVRAELRRQPEIATFLAVPFVCADWDTAQRLERIVDHAMMIAQLGAPFVVARGGRNTLCELPDPLDGYSVALETPTSMQRDGLLTLALIKDGSRFFALSFIFASSGDQRNAYVGAVQGSAGLDALEHNRAFTKAAFGVRPRDFMIEMFRLLCAQVGIDCIYGVSDASRHQKSAYFEIGAVDYDKVKLDYDAMWMERGGVRQPSGFFLLSVDPGERSLDSVPARKRALYRRRNAMWSEIAALIAWIGREPR